VGGSLRRMTFGYRRCGGCAAQSNLRSLLGNDAEMGSNFLMGRILGPLAYPVEERLLFKGPSSTRELVYLGRSVQVTIDAEDWRPCDCDNIDDVHCRG
jgi:hypothetical protein